MFADVVRDCTPLLGADHPETLLARDWHAYCTAEAGDPATARDLYTDLIPDRMRVLGPDHPDTLRVQNQQARYTKEAERTG